MCEGCRSAPCNCAAIEAVLQGNESLMDSLAELEAREKPGAKRCIGCMFFACRCGRGLRRKNV